MKTTLFFLGALTLLTLQSCQTDNRETDSSDNQDASTEQKTPVKMIEYLVGEWQMDSISGGSVNAARTNQTLTFTEEARYIVHTGNQKIDSGAFRMNEQLRNLYLESETNENPIEYEIDLKGDTLTLSPTQDTPQGKNIKYIYRKKL